MTSNKEYRKLERPLNDRRFLGVCAGLANFLGISPFWARIALVAALIPGGVPGILIYLIGWIIMPNERRA